jgi:L-xylulokinase
MSNGNDYIIGIDVGLTGMKAVAFDLDGAVVGTSTEASPQTMPRARWVERDGADFWELFGRMMRKLTGQLADRGGRVLAVGISAHGDGVWLLDDDGDPVRPGILSLDSRGIGVASELMRQHGDDLLRVTGQGAWPASPGVVLRWLAQHEPEALDRARWFVFAKDFLRVRLCGSVGSDLTEASTAFTGVSSQDYEDEAFAIYGLEDLRAKAPPIDEPYKVVGQVTRLAHMHTGLAEGVPVVAGLHDVDASAIGAGAVRPGQMAVIAGTFSINEVISDTPRVDGRWMARAFVERGTWMNMSVSPASSSNLEWFVQTLCQADLDIARRAGQDPYGFVDREVAEVGADDDPVTFLPYLYGNPLNVDASAVLGGLRAWHRRGHVLRGLYEGIAFNHRHHIDALFDGFEVDDVRVVGGVTRSGIWPQLFADTINRSIVIPTTPEGGALGTAMVAAVGAGAFGDLPEAAARMGSETRQVDPDPHGAERMEGRYRAYQRLVDAQIPWWQHQAERGSA